MTARPSITPSATEEEAAAIVVALDAAWPRASVADVDTRRAAGAWRFSGRWWTQPLPLRRARPWT